MLKTKYQDIADYKASLYANLLVAFKRSELEDNGMVMKPKMVKKDVSIMLKQSVLYQQQQTFIMRWNPAISNHKMQDFEQAMEEFYEDGFYYEWSIWDYQHVHVGDRFYMLKVGNGNTGIVMSGIIVGLPYKDKDWRGDGREVRYVRIIPYCMIHPDKGAIISTHLLDASIPEVIWNEGHSGVLLSKTQAAQLHALWQKRMKNIANK